MALANESLRALSDEQRRLVVAGLNEMLVELGQPEQTISDWWNLIAFPELGGRTPTQAWLAGDYDEVRDLVEGLYSASISTRSRFEADSSFPTVARSS